MTLIRYEWRMERTIWAFIKYTELFHESKAEWLIASWWLECFRLVIRHYCRTPRVPTLAPERPLILYFLLFGNRYSVSTSPLKYQSNWAWSFSFDQLNHCRLCLLLSAFNSTYVHVIHNTNLNSTVSRSTSPSLRPFPALFTIHHLKNALVSHHHSSYNCYSYSIFSCWNCCS